MRSLGFALCTFVTLVWSASRGAAQLDDGELRFTLDVDMISVAGVERDDDGPGGESEATVFGVGPNQLGGVHRTGLPTPFGLSLGYVLSPKVVLGMRVSFGLDVISAEGDDDNTRVLGLALMPGVTFVPLGDKAKLAFSGYPILQVERRRHDQDKNRTLLGGFGLSVGTLIFVNDALSADLGFHFEGRFGNQDDDDDRDDETEIRDLRGLVRLGLSLWS